MPIRNFFIVLYTTILAFCSLYAPQPLLPLLSTEFGVTADQAALLISVTLLPLGIAPILYGFLLESFSASTILKIAVFLLAVTESFFLWVDNFWVLVFIRGIQGLLLPAIFTALMTCISQSSDPQRVRRKIAFYVAATIIGGFSGRFIAGVMATYFHWQYAFLLIMSGLFIAFGLLFLLKNPGHIAFIRPTPKDLLTTLTNRVFRRIYAIIFLVFFCFAGLLNLLPFRMVSLDAEISEFSITLMYSGYLMGMVTTLMASQLSRWWEDIMGWILLSLMGYLLAIVLFSIPNIHMMFVAMFLFCGSMFLAHALLAGYLNQLATHHKGIANGLYISAYYLGGSLGAYYPVYFMGLLVGTDLLAGSV